ncbi:UbiA prenyltransferase [Pleurotus pulmonarius]
MEMAAPSWSKIPVRPVLILGRHVYTAILFTWTDIKTIFLPVMIFAFATVPINSLWSFIQCCFWTWIHLLLCNVSNQSRSRQEDALNHPWRPLPNGRVTEQQAVLLRYACIIGCMLLSATYSLTMLGITASLVVITILYDDLGLAGHCLGKSLCNIGGYTAFELGATKMIGNGHELGDVTSQALAISSLVIFTTIHAQDFADVDGDLAIGRTTLPIYAPQLSRVAILVLPCTWSMFVGWFWGVGPGTYAALVSIGSYVGLQFYLFRNVDADKKSYRQFNVWLLLIHLMPLHYRTSVFRF